MEMPETGAPAATVYNQYLINKISEDIPGTLSFIIFNNMNQTLHTKCCIVGGGPAGMMAAYLLARAGVEVGKSGPTADTIRANG